MASRFDNTSEGSRLELERFKTEVDFVAFLQKDGYKIDNSITTNVATALRHPETDSKIFIKTNGSGHQLYSDKHASVLLSGSGGSIIDYVQRYHGKNLGETRKVLREWVGSDIPNVSYSQYVNQVKREIPVYSEEYFKFGKLHNTQYLNERGISNDTIYSETFKGQIGQKSLESKTKPGVFYNNTVFPMYENISGPVVGLQVQNHVYSGKMAGSNNGFAFSKSNVPPGVEKPIISIAESKIDNLAHYELHNKGNRKGILYLSSNGELGPDKIKVLDDYLSKRDNKIGGYMLMNDNDASGVRFNINIIGNVNVKDSDVTIKISAEADKTRAKLTVVSEKPEPIEKFKNELNIINNKLPLTTNHDLQYRNIQTRKREDGKYELDFLFNNRKENLIPLETMAIKYRNSPFVVERAISKDFAKDLEDSLGIVRTKEATGIDDKGKPRFKNVWTPPAKGIGNDSGLER